MAEVREPSSPLRCGRGFAGLVPTPYFGGRSVILVDAPWSVLHLLGDVSDPQLWRRVQASRLLHLKPAICNPPTWVTMASIDLDLLLSPVGPDRPAGEDLEYDPLFSELEQAAAGKPEQQMGDVVIEGEEPDWRLVQRNSLALLERSKDLRVCGYLCQAALRNEGVEGFSTALQLTNRIASEFWETLHPELDADDDNDPTARVNAVMALAAGNLLRPIEMAPLLSVPLLGSVAWADVKPAAGEDEPRRASAEAQAIINNCEIEQIAARRGAVAASLDACESLERFVTQQVGTRKAPNLQPLRDLLKRIDAQFATWWEQRGGSDLPEVQEENGDDEDHPSAKPQSSKASAASGARKPTIRSNGKITSRQEAIATIDRILEYYQTHEPSSPLPLLLLRAKRLATKSFIEILQDLIPEGLGRAREIGGISATSELSEAIEMGSAETSYSSDDEADPEETEYGEEESDDEFFS